MIKKNSSCERFELGEKDEQEDEKEQQFCEVQTKERGEQEHQRGHQLRNNTNGTTKTSRESLGEEQ